MHYSASGVRHCRSRKSVSRGKGDRTIFSVFIYLARLRFDDHLARAALRAICDRRSGVRLLRRCKPPFRPYSRPIC